jgi:hypothetical protein
MKGRRRPLKREVARNRLSARRCWSLKPSRPSLLRSLSKCAGLPATTVLGETSLATTDAAVKKPIAYAHQRHDNGVAAHLNEIVVVTLGSFSNNERSRSVRG